MSDGELRFSGANRQRELRRLKRAYDDVAAAAEALANGRRIVGPTHRVVLIEAERGLGKTRLAMELYRHLTTTCDPDHYWPDTYGRVGENVHVMPRAETFDYRRSLPFLWWGVGVDPGAGVGSTVLGAMPDLLPHLVSARVTARRRETGREIAAEIADLAIEFGIPVAEGALEIVGLGTIKNLGMAAFKVGRALRRDAGEERTALGAAREQTDTLTDLVMSDLTALFSARSRRFAGVPLVILIDDAQFGDDDPTVAASVERLVARAARERWPLLLLLTHWGRQMGQWTDAKGKRHLPSRVSRVLRHAREGRPEEPGPAAKEGGGTLPDAAFVRIDLSEPVDDLSDALRERFPGLEPEDVAAIVARAGGNPRKLEQIIAKMERKPRWFEGGDLGQDLTESGREAVLALADLDILDVVVDRFADTPPEVRRALLVASLMGNRFVCDLVDRLARAQLDGAARAGLEEGERSYRLLRDVVDRARNDVATFNEQLFHEAAEEYRTSGMARNGLPGWPEDRPLHEALDDLLRGLVRAPDEFGGLTQDDHAEALMLAASRMEGAGDPLAGLALARLVEVENERGNPEGAYSAAQRFIAGFAG